MKLWRPLLIFVGICGLIAIRMVEGKLFYDPFLGYFELADKHAHFPEFRWPPLIFNYLLRFVLNLFCSAVILQALFRDSRWTMQGILMMVLVFAITFPVYLYCIYSHFGVGYLFSFYMRRFVIQPLVLLMIIPLFYYRKNLIN